MLRRDQRRRGTVGDLEVDQALRDDAEGAAERRDDARARFLRIDPLMLVATLGLVAASLIVVGSATKDDIAARESLPAAPVPAPPVAKVPAGESEPSGARSNARISFPAAELVEVYTVPESSDAAAGAANATTAAATASASASMRPEASMLLSLGRDRLSATTLGVRSCGSLAGIERFADRSMNASQAGA